MGLRRHGSAVRRVGAVPDGGCRNAAVCADLVRTEISSVAERFFGVLERRAKELFGLNSVGPVDFDTGKSID
jgi:hypothetical protein